MLANYPWAWALPWCVADIPNETPLEKTDFSVCLQRSSWRGWGESPWPLSSLSAKTPSSLLLRRSCACSHNLCMCLCASAPCVWKTLLLWEHPSPLAPKIYCLLFLLNPWEEGFSGDTLSSTKCSKVSSPLYIVQLEVAVLIPIYDVVWVRHCSMDAEIHH